jgi:Fur family transcriptional regulator, iron response regulator
MLSSKKDRRHRAHNVEALRRDSEKKCALNLAYIKLHRAEIRMTRQRLQLGVLIFRDHPRHITADMLFKEAQETNLNLSLATVYNTLNHFTENRLLRKLVIDGGKTYFDTDVSQHHHFFIEEDETLVDIPNGWLMAPNPPKGFRISNVDFVVRLRKENLTSQNVVKVRPSATET